MTGRTGSTRRTSKTGRAKRISRTSRTGEMNVETREGGTCTVLSALCVRSRACVCVENVCVFVWREPTMTRARAIILCMCDRHTVTSMYACMCMCATLKPLACTCEIEHRHQLHCRRDMHDISLHSWPLAHRERGDSARERESERERNTPVHSTRSCRMGCRSAVRLSSAPISAGRLPYVSIQAGVFSLGHASHNQTCIVCNYI